MKNVSAFAALFIAAALFSFTACDNAGTATNNQTTEVNGAATAEANSEEEMEERNKENMRQFLKALEESDSTKLLNLMAENSAEHTPMDPSNPPKSNRDIVSGMVQMMAAFPDMKNEVKHMVAEGDMVMTYMTSTGTFKKDFMGMKANDKSFKSDGVDIVKFNSEGKATDHWGVYDNYTMMSQLGMIPGAEGHASDKK